MIKSHYSTGELAKLKLTNWPITRRGFNYIARREEWVITRIGHGGRYVYAYDALPEPLQEDIRLAVTGLNSADDLKSVLRQIVREEIARALEGLNV